MQNQEVEYLERVNKVINDRIIQDKEQLDYYLEQIKIIPDDDENKFSMTEKWIEVFQDSIKSLKRHQDKPYFARIDFKANDTNVTENHYIGKISLLDKNTNPLVIDWRTPIANLYYDSSLGETAYKTNDGSSIRGELNLKRVYTIEDSKLINYIDVHSSSDDELLKPFLGVNADNKIKNIVSSIQKEQNEIIREPLYKNIVVQGVAGSGKTTVMLHRIAFLAYNYQDVYKTSQYLVLSPNKLFTDYISAILPDLEVDKVKQITYEELFLEYLKLKFKPTLLTRNKGSEYDYVAAYKSSKECIERIEEFFKKYESNLIHRDLTYKGIIIIKKEDIYKLYPASTKDPLEVKIKKLQEYLYNLTQKDSHYLINNINSQLKELDNIYPQRKKEHFQLGYEIKTLFIKGIKDVIKNHFKCFDSNIYKLYMEFINTLINYDVRNRTINNLSNKKLDYDDLANMMYLKYLVNGSKQYDSYISVNVDEAQDLGYNHFIVLKKIFRGAYFTIVGDLSQSIYAYRGIRNWKDIEHIFNTNMKYLSKSYRNTIEIMNYANKILGYLQVELATPVIRHGNQVNEIKYENKIATIIDRINFYKNDYTSIAIITKNKEEVDILYQELSPKINISKIDESTSKYDGGICILPIYLAKGLEFDSVILVDIDKENYNIDNVLDMKLLYVGITRALHELDILYKNEKIDIYKKAILS